MHNLSRMQQLILLVFALLMVIAFPIIMPARAEMSRFPLYLDIKELYLPIVLRTLPRFAPVCSVTNNFCEPNNAPEIAYGPLGNTQVFPAYPEDSYDYFYITLPVKGSLKVELTGYNATGNLLIYRFSDTTNPIANWGQGGSNMTLNLSNLDAGNYFILVYTASGFNTSALYTLKATF